MNAPQLFDPQRRPARRWFWFGCAFELFLLVVAVSGAWWLDLSLADAVRWRAADIGLGVLGALPLLGLFSLSLGVSWRPFREIREFLETVFGRIACHWSVPQIGLLAALAGVAEETLFRGVLQAGLTPVTGPTFALLLAGLCFGLFHFVTAGYAALATVMGIYLGWLWQSTDNLLVPVVTHAVYDFAAILWLLRRQPSDGA